MVQSMRSSYNGTSNTPASVATRSNATDGPEELWRLRIEHALFRLAQVLAYNHGEQARLMAHNLGCEPPPWSQVAQTLILKVEAALNGPATEEIRLAGGQRAADLRDYIKSGMQTSYNNAIKKHSS